MAEQGFEAELARLFQEHPAFPDSAQFAQEVEQRLNRGWSLRRIAISVLGLVGGVVSVIQVAGASVVDRASALSAASVKAAERGAGTVPAIANSLSQAANVRGLSMSGLTLGGLPLGGEIVWLVLGLAVLAVAFLATRIMEEI
jgi:hypothetical protein